MKTDQIITQKQWEKIRRAESEAPAEMVTTPGLSAVPSLASAGWLDARATRREELWARAYGGAAESKCDITRQMARMIADGALRAFDERFGASNEKLSDG